MTDESHCPIEYEVGSGNVFADLGLEDAGDRLARARIGFSIHTLVAGRGLSRHELAEVLGIVPRKAAHLLNGHFNRFALEELQRFGNCLRGSGMADGAGVKDA
jgi:predicted XRE-type DNA-binding protein